MMVPDCGGAGFVGAGMREVETVPPLRESVREARCAGRSIALVPTMGYLHDGHLSLARQARAENDLVVMSVYVNPTQFGAGEDLDRYPRDLDRDRLLAQAAEVDVLFVPAHTTMYPSAQVVWVDPGPLADHLCGPTRRGHFRGVATVVAKLFAMIQPDRAYFGQKDAQQAMIVRRMARDLGFPIEVRVVPTVRERDGLALSSRNVYLSPEERRQALARALDRARRAAGEGERSTEILERDIRRGIATEAPLARLDYVTIADPSTLQPLEANMTGDALVALAAYFGSTRLIDNVVIHVADLANGGHEGGWMREGRRAQDNPRYPEDEGSGRAHPHGDRL